MHPLPKLYFTRSGAVWPSTGATARWLSPSEFSEAPAGEHGIRVDAEDEERDQRCMHMPAIQAQKVMSLNVPH